MKKLFYARLAVTGILKNYRTYVPYLLTCSGMVMMRYIIYFLGKNETIAGMAGGDTLQAMLGLGGGVIGVFALIFLCYTSSFLTRSRKREFGLYNILGMGKGNLAKIMIWESLIMAAASLVVGLSCGVLFSKLSELCIARVLDGAVSYSFSVDWKALGHTVTLFLFIFLVILLRTLGQVGKSNPIELLNSAALGEKPPKGNWILAVLGILLLGAAYYLAVSVENPDTAFVWFFGAVDMVIVATYLLFIAGSVTLCRLLQKRKSYYYKANHFISLSSMAYRMKRNGAGLASICILSTIVLVMVSSSMCLFIGKEGSLRSIHPRNIGVETNSVDSGVTDQVHRLVDQAVEESGLRAEKLVNYRYLSMLGCFEGDQVMLSEEAVGHDMTVGYSKLRLVLVVPLSDYNRITGEAETLEPDEVLLSCTKDNTYAYETITLEGTGTRQVKRLVPEFVKNGLEGQMVFSAVFVVVPEEEAFLELEQSSREIGRRLYSGVKDYYGFDLDCEDKKQEELAGRIAELAGERGQEEEAEFTVSCAASDRARFYGRYGGLFVLGILLGSVFVLAAVLIIYYKQITEGYEDQSRFEVMQKVGMTERDIRRSINSQMLTVFLLPLLLAGLHLTFAFPFVQKLLLLFGLMDTRLLLLTTLGCYLVFALFYALVYKITSRAYYRIVSRTGKE